MNKFKMAPFVRANLLGDRCESINSKKANYTHINSKYHKSIQKYDLKIPDFNLFKTCFT